MGMHMALLSDVSYSCSLFGRLPVGYPLCGQVLDAWLSFAFAPRLPRA